MFTYLHNRYFDYSIKNPLPQATDLLKLNGILAFYYRIIFRNMYYFTFFVSFIIFRNMYHFTFFVSFIFFRNMYHFTFFVSFIFFRNAYPFTFFVSFISLNYRSSFLYCSQTTSNILPRLHLGLLQGEFPSWSQALHLHYLQG